MAVNVHQPLYDAQKAGYDVFDTGKSRFEVVTGACSAGVGLVKSAVCTSFWTTLWVAGGTLQCARHPIGTTKKVFNTVYPFNPINGRRRFVIIPKCVEKFLGDKVLYPFAIYGSRSSFESLPGSEGETIAHRVEEVTQTLLRANADLLNPPNEPTQFNYRVRTIQSPYLNAFSLPGGGMVVYTQFVKEIDAAIQSGGITRTEIQKPNGDRVFIDLSDVTLDDVLGGLIGHEMTHAASRHGISMGLVLVAAIISEVASFLLVDLPFPRILEWINDKFFDLILFFQSKKREYESDVTGAYLAHKAVYNPVGSLYLQEFSAQSRDDTSKWFHRHFEFLYTHPHEENRKLATWAAIQEFAPEKLIEVPQEIDT